MTQPNNKKWIPGWVWLSDSWIFQTLGDLYREGVLEEKLVRRMTVSKKSGR